MTIDILICTIDDGVGSVRQVLMPPAPDVHYVVSVQHSRPLDEMSAAWRTAVDALALRDDVTLTTLEGRGLSRNRNNALCHAKADIVIIADDDCRYHPDNIARVQRAYTDCPQADIVCFAAEGYDGTPLKRYPTASLAYAEACKQGYYPTSFELTFRRKAFVGAALSFNEHYGLGAPRFTAGEEEVLLADAESAELKVVFVPEVITQTDAATTGRAFLRDPRLQVTKGAVFRHRFGLAAALWRTLKEGAYHLVYNHANPLPIWFNMLQGIGASR